MKKIILFSLSLALLACQGESQQERDERLGSEQLSAARAAFADGQYDAARDSVRALRHDHPLAMEARRQAILLLDSIELRAAEDSLNALPADADTVVTPKSSLNEMSETERLSVKVKFFQRKIQEDLKKQGR